MGANPLWEAFSSMWTIAEPIRIEFQVAWGLSMVLESFYSSCPQKYRLECAANGTDYHILLIAILVGGVV